MENSLILNKQTLLSLLVMISFFLFPNPMGATAANQMAPSSIIKIPENENAILVEKKTQTLLLYSSKTLDLSIQFQVPCSTGEVSGVKQRAGDKKTPEGIYFLKDEYEDKYLSPIYGKMAFPTDYPNFMDKRTGRTGSAIWIHGTNKNLIPMDSNGCIALENSDILMLSDYINLDSTPVILVEKIDRVEKAMVVKQEKEINHLLDQWMETLVNGNRHDYLSFYATPNSPDITWWEHWFEIRELAEKLGYGMGVERQRTGIYYHNHVFVVLFDYFLRIQNEKVLIGKRKLFLENQTSGYKIIGDEYQQTQKKFQSSKAPLVTAAKIFFESGQKKTSN